MPILTGDVPANIEMLTGESIVRNADNSAYVSNLIGEVCWSVNLTSPSNGATKCMGYIPAGYTLLGVNGIIAGGTNAVFNVEERISIGKSGTDIMGSDLTVTTAGESSSPISYSTTSDIWLVAAVTTISGTVNNLIINVTGVVT